MNPSNTTSPLLVSSQVCSDVSMKSLTFEPKGEGEVDVIAVRYHTAFLFLREETKI